MRHGVTAQSGEESKPAQREGGTELMAQAVHVRGVRKASTGASETEAGKGASTGGGPGVGLCGRSASG